MTRGGSASRWERDLKGLRSARRDPHRILYEIIDEQLVVMVIQVDQRTDIYRPR